MHNVSTTSSKTYADELNDTYREMLGLLRAKFEETSANKVLYLGSTRKSELGKALQEAYIGGLPDEIKQHYRCNTCFHFMHLVGGLMIIEPEPKPRFRSALWDFLPSDHPWYPIMNTMKDIAERHETSALYQMENGRPVQPQRFSIDSLNRDIGIACNGEFNHLSVTVYGRLNVERSVREKLVPEFFTTAISNGLGVYAAEAATWLGAKWEDSGHVKKIQQMHDLNEYVKKATNYRINLNTDPTTKLAIYKFAERLADVEDIRSDDVAKINNTPVGLFLKKINEYMGDDTPIARTAENITAACEYAFPHLAAAVSSINYMRPKSVASNAGFERLLELVESNGLAGSINTRRIAGIDDLRERFFWSKSGSAVTEQKSLTHLDRVKAVRGASEATPVLLTVDEGSMSWVKFERLYISTGKALEILAAPGIRPSASVPFYFNLTSDEWTGPLFKHNKEFPDDRISHATWQGGIPASKTIRHDGRSISEGYPVAGLCRVNTLPDSVFMVTEASFDAVSQLCLFPTLMSDDLLRPNGQIDRDINRAIEQLSSTGQIEPDRNGCVSFVVTEGRPVGIPLVVTTASAKVKITIDRWD